MQDLINSYLIIGGPNTKKSEVSSLLAKTLKYKLINLDRDKYSYFNDFTDFDSEYYYNLMETKGELNAISYIHKYEMQHLNHVLDNISDNVVIDFGNTYLIIENNTILDKIKRFRNIILLKKDNIKTNNILEKKLYRNKILDEIKTIEINIDNKEAKDIVKEIINYKKYKDIL